MSQFPLKRAARLTLIWLVLVVAGLPAVARATEEAPADGPSSDEPDTGADEPVAGPSEEQLTRGSLVYSANCSSCHQPGGVGLSGQFPPLRDNPNIADSDYFAATIRSGRQGEIDVLGVRYDGRMPAFSSLADEDVDAVIAYVQSGFLAPVAEVGEPTIAVRDGDLPALTDMTIVVAFLISLGVVALAIGPRFISAPGRLDMPWLDAWLKTGAIVFGFIAFTVFVPSLVLETDTVSELDRVAQDLIGTAVWAGALAAGLWALWYAHRRDHI